MKIYDVIILGAGASGLMCASHLDKSLNIAIVESNEKVAKKLKVSGGGKCNITNKFVDIKNFDGDAELISNALDIYSRDNLLDFLKENNVLKFSEKGSKLIIIFILTVIVSGSILTYLSITHISNYRELLEKKISEEERDLTKRFSLDFQVNPDSLTLKLAKEFQIENPSGFRSYKN